VSREQGPVGSVVLRAGRRELGHLHGDAVVDVPLAAERDSDWVTVQLATEDGVQQALALLRGNYEAE
jgi:hypothetical protein